MALTTTRIDQDYIAKLKLIAKRHKRSMAQELSHLIDQELEAIALELDIDVTDLK